MLNFNKTNAHILSFEWVIWKEWRIKFWNLMYLCVLKTFKNFTILQYSLFKLVFLAVNIQFFKNKIMHTTVSFGIFMQILLCVLNDIHTLFDWMRSPYMGTWKPLK